MTGQWRTFCEGRHLAGAAVALVAVIRDTRTHATPETVETHVTPEIRVIRELQENAILETTTGAVADHGNDVESVDNDLRITYVYAYYKGNSSWQVLKYCVRRCMMLWTFYPRQPRTYAVSFIIIKYFSNHLQLYKVEELN